MTYVKVIVAILATAFSMLNTAINQKVQRGTTLSAQKVGLVRPSKSVLIKWKAPTGNITGYNIYRGDQGLSGSHPLIGSVNAKTFSYADKSIVVGIKYNYFVRSVMNGVDSKDSNIVSITVK